MLYNENVEWPLSSIILSSSFLNPKALCLHLLKILLFTVLSLHMIGFIIFFNANPLFINWLFISLTLFLQIFKARLFIFFWDFSYKLRQPFRGFLKYSGAMVLFILFKNESPTAFVFFLAPASISFMKAPILLRKSSTDLAVFILQFFTAWDNMNLLYASSLLILLLSNWFLLKLETDINCAFFNHFWTVDFNTCFLSFSLAFIKSIIAWRKTRKEILSDRAMRGSLWQNFQTATCNFEQPLI